MKKRAFLCLALALVQLLVLWPAAALTATAGGEVLSVGKSYTLEYESPIDGAFPARTYQEEGALTDGKKASSANHRDEAFLHLYRGTSVIVTIDLETECAVSAVELGSLQIGGAGIVCPRYIHVAVSTDGESFGTVGTLEDPRSATLQSTQLIRQTVTLEQAYRARYVRVTFSSDVYVYADELTVTGSKDPAGAATATPDAPVEDAGYAKPIDGINSIALMYTIGHYTEAELLPVLTYVDTAGAPTDTLFDSMLFLPSGVSSFDYAQESGWEDYRAELFGLDGGYNLAALDALVGKNRSVLGLADGEGYPVFLSVPFLDIGTTPIYGIRPDSLENRSAIIRKFVDSLLVEFEGAGFENLTLKGLYWHDELIPYTKSDYEEQLVMQFNAYVHEKGYKTIWIPYYCAPGFERAQALGFDAATLQSGYAFSRSDAVVAEIGEVQPKSVQDSAAKAKKFGLGMEFELDTGRNDSNERFYEYLYNGYASGCMTDGIMMMYHSVKGLQGLAKASGSTADRRTYDLLYQYIKGEFSSIAPSVAEGQVIVLTANSKKSGNLAVNDPDSLRSEMRAVVTASSDELSFLLEGDGFYLINATKTPAGAYSITFSISDGRNKSAEVTVPIYVLDDQKELPEVTAPDGLYLYDRLAEDATATAIPAGTTLRVAALSDGWVYATCKVDGAEIVGYTKALQVPNVTEESSDLPSDNSAPAPVSDGFPWWIVVVAVVAVAAVVVVLILILQKKKKR